MILVVFFPPKRTNERSLEASRSSFELKEWNCGWWWEWKRELCFYYSHARKLSCIKYHASSTLKAQSYLNIPHFICSLVQYEKERKSSTRSDFFYSFLDIKFFFFFFKFNCIMHKNSSTSCRLFFLFFHQII